MNIAKELYYLDFSIKSREYLSSEILNNPNQIREVINFFKTLKFEHSEKIISVLEFAF